MSSQKSSQCLNREAISPALHFVFGLFVGVRVVLETRFHYVTAAGLEVAM